MRAFVSILVGLPPVVAFVILPMWAQTVAKVANGTDIDPAARASLLFRANSVDKCDTKILDSLGTVSAQMNRYDLSVWAFGQAILCEPGMAIFRAKYGAAMQGMNWDGLFSMKEAATLEPHNPLYTKEVERLTKHQ